MFISTKLDKAQSLRDVAKVAHRLYEDLDTPTSLACHLLLTYKQYDQLVSKSIDPLHYNSAWDFSKDYQAISFLAKYPDLDTSFDRDDRALQKFMESEALCKTTNAELSNRLRLNSDVSSVFYIAQRKIASWLEGIQISRSDFRFGPGASSSCRGVNYSIPDKLQSKLECTYSAQWVYQWLLEMPHFRACSSNIDDSQSSILPREMHIVNSNQLVFVPKNAKISRAICIEPDLNIIGQLSIGAALRRALYKCGLDINHRAPRDNSRLACQGSLKGDYATLDLSSASDTISYKLVMELFPTNWFCLLDSLRSPFTRMPDGTLHENEKFSSMGNGFTFEMETMIFLAIARSVREHLGCNGEVSVFGDDIVIPTGCYHLTVRTLETLGFLINTEKSFSTGPFRESCGKDYFFGTNVRPYFLKETPDDPIKWFKVCNGIRHYCVRIGFDHISMASPLLKRTWRTAVNCIPSKYRLYGPSCLGDQVIWQPRRENRTVQYQFGIHQVSYAQPVMAVVHLSRYPIAVQLGSALLACSPEIPLRGSLKGYRVKRTSVSSYQWDEGAWLD